MHALLNRCNLFIILILAASHAGHFHPIWRYCSAETEKRRRRRRVDGVYVGCHGHRFPEIPADKHREHVVRGWARAYLYIALYKPASLYDKIVISAMKCEILVISS